MSTSLLGTKLLPYHHAPTEYNADDFYRVKYLYRQAGKEFAYTSNDEEDMIVDDMDEGFIDESVTVPFMSEHVLTMTVGVGAPGDEEEGDKEEQDEDGQLDEDEVYICMLVII